MYVSCLTSEHFRIGTFRPMDGGWMRAASTSLSGTLLRMIGLWVTWIFAERSDMTTEPQGRLNQPKAFRNSPKRLPLGMVFGKPRIGSLRSKSEYCTTTPSDPLAFFAAPAVLLVTAILASLTKSIDSRTAGNSSPVDNPQILKGLSYNANAPKYRVCAQCYICCRGTFPKQVESSHSLRAALRTGAIGTTGEAYSWGIQKDADSKPSPIGSRWSRCQKG